MRFEKSGAGYWSLILKDKEIDLAACVNCKQVMGDECWTNGLQGLLKINCCDNQNLKWQDQAKEIIEKFVNKWR